MGPEEMKRLIDTHIEAEMAGDPALAVSVYTDDVEHDPVGVPGAPFHGRDAAEGLYEQLVRDLRTEEMRSTHEYYGDDFCVMEHVATATVPGSLLGIAGNDRRVSFRMLHVWEFRDGKISRENVWLDGGGVVAQLTAPTTGALA